MRRIMTESSPAQRPFTQRISRARRCGARRWSTRSCTMTRTPATSRLLSTLSCTRRCWKLAMRLMALRMEFLRIPPSAASIPKSLLCKDADAPSCLRQRRRWKPRSSSTLGRSDSCVEVPVPRLGARQRNRMGDALRAEAHGAGGRDFYKFLVFQDANWNYLTFNAERDMACGGQDRRSPH